MIRRITHRLRRVPPIGSFVKRMDDRRSRRDRQQLAMSYLRPRLKAVDRWLNESRETTNFTYDLHPTSIDYLAAAIATATGVNVQTVRQYIDEIQCDDNLRRHIRVATEAESSEEGRVADADAKLGRRLGWYAIARIVHPRVIVETGIDKGLGSCVLCAALMANKRDGYPGRYFGTDINPAAGWLLTEPYREFGEVLYGDSIESLRSFDQPIDLFINDSDHSGDYEKREYQIVEKQLSPGAVVIGDNAHVTRELFDFAQATNRQFLYWPEWPQGHWYPGGGIGLAWDPDVSANRSAEGSKNHASQRDR